MRVLTGSRTDDYDQVGLLKIDTSSSTVMTIMTSPYEEVRVIGAKEEYTIGHSSSLSIAGGEYDIIIIANRPQFQADCDNLAKGLNSNGQTVRSCGLNYNYYQLEVLEEQYRQTIISTLLLIIILAIIIVIMGFSVI